MAKKITNTFQKPLRKNVNMLYIERRKDFASPILNVLLDGNLDGSEDDASGDEHEQQIHLISQPSLGNCMIQLLSNIFFPVLFTAYCKVRIIKEYIVLKLKFLDMVGFTLSRVITYFHIRFSFL